MTDVRLTALNPVDSQVYPVACNTSGELIVEQVAPDPDLTVTGNLTVNGTSSFDGSITAESTITATGSATFQNNVTLENKSIYIKSTSASEGLYVGRVSAGNYNVFIFGDGSITTTGDVTCSDNTKGVILTSPNGTNYRISVANDGTLSTSTV